MQQSTNEAGTPVYSVTIGDTRRVTLNQTFTILGGTRETAIKEAEDRAARQWRHVAELGGLTLGPVETVDLADDATATKIGEALARALRVRRDPEHADGWAMGPGIGWKTSAGLARTVARIMAGEEL